MTQQTRYSIAIVVIIVLRVTACQNIALLDHVLRVKNTLFLFVCD